MKCAGCPNELPPNRAQGRQRKWCSERCRKKTCYSGVCVDCGTTTSVSRYGSAPSERCTACSHRKEHEAAVWTRDRLLAEARRWHELVGRWPTTTDWNIRDGAHSTCSPEHRELVTEFKRQTGPWPGRTVAVHVFGSWGSFMEAAGGVAVGTVTGIRRGQRAAELRAALERLET